jgi:hypothetical protein
MIHFLSKSMLTYGDSNASFWIVVAYVFIVLEIVLSILCLVLDSFPCFAVALASVIVALIFCLRFSVIESNKASVKNIKEAITSKYADATFINAEADEGLFTYNNKLCRYTVEDRKITLYITTDDNIVKTHIIE